MLQFKARVASRIVAIALCALVAVGPVATAPANAATPKETKLAKLVNNYRAAKGRSKLKVRPKLTKFAHKHSKAMASAGQLYHSTTGQLLNYMKAVNCTVVGENVGVAVGTVTDLHKAFKASTAHRKTMLKRSWKKMGVGVVAGPAGSLYATEIFCG